MARKSIAFLLTCVLLSLACRKAPPIPVPTIQSVTPFASSGDLIQILGENLDYATAVVFNEMPTGNWVLVEPERIFAFVPDSLLPGIVEVYLTAGEASSNKVQFELILPRPVIQSIVPSGADVGETILILGRRFGNDSLLVEFNGTIATDINARTDSSLQVVVPQGAQSGPVTVVNPNGTSNDVNFNVGGGMGVIVPKITAILPITGNYQGGPVIIEGENIQSVSQVIFGNIPVMNTGLQVFPLQGLIATNVPVNNSLASTTIPLSLMDMSGAVSNSVNFTVPTGLSPNIPPIGATNVVIPLPPIGINSLPMITNVWMLITYQNNLPASGVRVNLQDGLPLPDGFVTIELNGDSIGRYKPDGSIIEVRLNGIDYQGKQDSVEGGTGLRAILMPTTPGEQLEMVFPYLLDQLSPTSGPPGTTVELHGRFFLQQEFQIGDVDIQFGGSSVQGQWVSPLLLTFQVPSGASPGAVAIQVGSAGLGGFSNPLSFTVTN